MTIHEQLVEYRCDDTLLEGFLCCGDGQAGSLPAVMVAHTWVGREEFVEQKARRLASQGYVAFALDMYGKGKVGRTADECQALMTPLVEDRELLSNRINSALTCVRQLPQVDARRVAAIGFCFGGMCVLDLARGGADVRGVVSFHGLFKPTGLPETEVIRAKVLILHGYEDPFAPAGEIHAIAQELTQAHADWQIHVYGRTMHSFTNLEANDPAAGQLYSEVAQRRSWCAMMQFLDEVLR